MVYLPAHTVEEKVAALRACLPGIDLYNFLKGMPTALARSKQTVPRGMEQLREVSFFVPNLRRSPQRESEGRRQRQPRIAIQTFHGLFCWQCFSWILVCARVFVVSKFWQLAPPRHVLCQTIRVLFRSIAVAATVACLLRA